MMLHFNSCFSDLVFTLYHFNIFFSVLKYNKLLLNFFLLLFKYSCLHFLPTSPPHPTPLRLPHSLALSMCPLYMYTVLILSSFFSFQRYKYNELISSLQLFNNSAGLSKYRSNIFGV